MPSVVIFDLYGTLIRLSRDSRPYLHLCRSCGVLHRLRLSLSVHAPTLEDFCIALGVSCPSNLGQLQSDLDKDIDSAKLFDDVIPTLDVLREKQISLALISNLASPYKQPFFELGLDRYFECAVFSCDIGVAKPAAAIYQSVLAYHGITANDAMMVGDNHRADVSGPSACGIRGYHIDRQHRCQDKASLRTLKDVLPLVKPSP